MDATGLDKAFYIMFSVCLEASTDLAGRTAGDPYGTGVSFANQSLALASNAKRPSLFIEEFDAGG